jgi:hypothetical protein
MKTRILLSIVFTALLVGCSPKQLDVQHLVVKREINIPLRSAFYSDVAWLSENTIGLVYYLKVPDTTAPSPDDLLSIFNFNTSDLKTIAMPKTDATCESKWLASKWEPGVISRANQGNLVIAAECSADPMGGPVLLLKYDVLTSELQKLSDYNKQRVGLLHFAFLSENELVQERPVGHPMNNQLYKVSLVDGSATRLLPDFLRARWPTWSPQNQLVGFWGTAQFPGKEPEGLYTFNDIEVLVRAPWDLYVMDKDGNNPQIIFPLISNIGGLAWSPNGDWLAFGGKVDNVEGIWLLNINDRRPIRIYDQNDIFDWSPDGREIIIIGTKEFDAKNNDVPVKAYILELPKCVFENNCE